MKNTSLSICSLALVAILYSPALASDNPSFESRLIEGHKAIVSKQSSSPIASGIDRSYGCSRTRCRISGSRLVCGSNGIEIATGIDGCLNGGKISIEVKVEGEIFHFAFSCNILSADKDFDTKTGKHYMAGGGMCTSVSPSCIFEVRLSGDWSSTSNTCLPILCQP